MKIDIISVGKKSGPEVTKLCVEYEKRLPRNLKPSWYFIDNSGNLPLQRRKEAESRQIAKFCKDGLVVLLDERGERLNNQLFANKLQDWEQQDSSIKFVIGGAYGVSQEIVQPDIIWSLSDLVFPHGLTRLILVEQIYRASTISRGLPYHHE